AGGALRVLRRPPHRHGHGRGRPRGGGRDGRRGHGRRAHQLPRLRRGPGEARRGGRMSIVAIDGPAGTGKSTVARGVAARLGLAHLDTGAMYRAVTWVVLQQGGHPEDGDAAVAALTASYAFEDDRVVVDGEDITDA